MSGTRSRSATHSVPILANFEALPEMLTARDLEGILQIDRKTVYSHAKRGLIPYVRIESSLRFPKHRILEWLEERAFEPRAVHGKGAKRQ